MKGIGSERGLFLVGIVVVVWLFIAAAGTALFWRRVPAAIERFVGGDPTPPVFPPEDTVVAEKKSRQEERLIAAAAEDADADEDADVVEPFQVCYLNGSGSIGKTTGGPPDPLRVPKDMLPTVAPAAPAKKIAIVAAIKPDYTSPYANIPGAVASMMETPGAADTNDGLGAWRPCEVYFTDHMKTCDANEFRYHPAYYEKKLADVRKAVAARGGTPTAEQNDLILRYTRILEDYKKFPQNQHCKLSLPNWKVRVTEPDTPFISKNLHNAERGAPSDWAFCWRRNDDPDLIRETGMIVQEKGGNLEGKDIDGVYHVRGTFDEDISRDGVLQTYCTETSEAVREYKIKSAIVVEDAPGARTIRFYKNEAPTELTEADVNRYFRDQLFRMTLGEKRQGNRRIGRVVAQPQLRSFRLVKLMKDPCDRTVEHYDTMATVEFGSDIELASTILGQGNDYLHGLIPTLETRIDDNDSLIKSLQDDIDNLKKRKNAIINDLKKGNKELEKLIKIKNGINDNIQRCLMDPYRKIAGLWRRVDFVGLYSGSKGYYINVNPTNGAATVRIGITGTTKEVLGQFTFDRNNPKDLYMIFKYAGTNKYFTKLVNLYNNGKLMIVDINPTIIFIRPNELPLYSNAIRAADLTYYMKNAGPRISFKDMPYPK